MYKYSPYGPMWKCQGYLLKAFMSGGPFMSPARIHLAPAFTDQFFNQLNYLKKKQSHHCRKNLTKIILVNIFSIVNKELIIIIITIISNKRHSKSTR